MKRFNFLFDVFNELKNNVVVDGLTVPVFIRADQPKDVPVPSIIVEVPQTQTDTTLDRTEIVNVRLIVRVHDRKSDGWYATRSVKISEELQDVLRPNITSGGNLVGMFVDSTVPQTYSIEGQEATDVLVTFETFI